MNGFPHGIISLERIANYFVERATAGINATATVVRRTGSELREHTFQRYLLAGDIRAPEPAEGRPTTEKSPMRIHAIQTGTVKIKTAQVEGRGHGIRRQLAVYTDGNWTDWLPTYAWAIEHPEGVIVVDTGQGVHLLETSTSYHPFLRWEVAFRIERKKRSVRNCARSASDRAT